MGLSSARSRAQLCHAQRASHPGLCLKIAVGLKKSQEWIFFWRKLEKDPKSSEVTALLSPLGCSLPASSSADLGNHHDHCDNSSHLFLPPKARVTHKTQPPRVCAHAARALPGVNDRTHPRNSCSWHPSPLLQPLGMGAASSLHTRPLGSFLLLPASPCSCPLLRWTLLQLCLPTRLG